MSPEKRAQVEQSYRDFQSLTPAERERVLHKFARYEKLSHDRRASLHQALRDYLDSSPADRTRFLENLERWRGMSPAERERAREDGRRQRPGRSPGDRWGSPSSRCYVDPAPRNYLRLGVREATGA